VSKFVDDIVEDIRINPDTWNANSSRHCSRNDGLKKDGLEITDYGNTKLLSVVSLYIDGVRTETRFIDNWRLESAVLWWYKNASLEDITR